MYNNLYNFVNNKCYMYPNFLMNFLHILQGQSQLAHNVSETSPERPLKVLASGAYRGPSEASEGTNTKLII